MVLSLLEIYQLALRKLVESNGSEGLSPTLTTMQGGDKIPKILIPEPIQFLKVREATKKRICSSRDWGFNQFRKTKFSVSSW